jgi:hypothetical protein
VKRFRVHWRPVERCNPSGQTHREQTGCITRTWLVHGPARKGYAVFCRDRDIIRTAGPVVHPTAPIPGNAPLGRSRGEGGLRTHGLPLLLAPFLGRDWVGISPARVARYVPRLRAGRAWCPRAHSAETTTPSPFSRAHDLRCGHRARTPLPPDGRSGLCP